jgi:hypothetical protein
LAIPADDPSSTMQRPRERPSVAGFQVIMSGRFWVITEGDLTVDTTARSVPSMTIVAKLRSGRTLYGRF